VARDRTRRIDHRSTARAAHAWGLPGTRHGPPAVRRLIPLGVALQLAPGRLTALGDGFDLRWAVLPSWLVGAGILLVVCWGNRRLLGFKVCALGLSVNALVIAFNRGMPVAEEALVALDVDAAKAGILEHHFYHVAGEGTRLLFLADVLPIAGPRTLESVVSLGDVLLLVGIVVVVLESSLPGRR